MPAPGPAPRRLRRRLMAAGAAILVLLVAARLALPSILTRYVNGVLQRSPDYDGSISGVSVHLWRGAYTVRDIRIVHMRHAVPIPFLECPRLDLALDWSALVHGEARARVRMEHPKLNFVAGPSDEETQTGADQPWLGMLNDLYPFRIDKAEVVDGEIAFHTFHTNPQVHVRLTELRAQLENLTNVRDSTEPLMATISAKGRAMESGRLKFEMKFDPESRRPTFELAARLLGLDTTELNSLALAYGGFDFEQGRFDLVLEVTAKDGLATGYIKPLFREVRIVGPRDVSRGPLALLWQSLVGAAGQIVRNRPRDQIGTRVAFEGELDSPRLSILETIGGLLRNAFIQAYLPQFEGRLAPDLTIHADPGSDEPDQSLPRIPEDNESQDRSRTSP